MAEPGLAAAELHTSIRAVLPAEPVNLVLVRIGNTWAYVTLGDTAEEALQRLEPSPWSDYGSHLRYALLQAQA